MLLSVIVAVFVAGLVVTPAGSAFLGNGAGTNSAGIDPANPPMSVATAHGCADQHARNASGWLVETGSEEEISLTFNQTTDCVPATSVQAAVSLPRNYSTFSVVHNGETVVQTHNTHETTTRVWNGGRNTTR